MTGITLIHAPDRLRASPGQTITFTSWVTNDTVEPVHGITLIPRFFTNAGLAKLTYSQEPAEEELNLGTLLPGETTFRNFNYIDTGTAKS